MKSILVALCFLAGSAAMAQVGGSSTLNNEPVIIEFNSHQTRATQAGMSETQNVMEVADPTVAQGERPLWEVAPPKPTAMPLGDVARMLKKEKMVAKKSDTVWVN